MNSRRHLKLVSSDRPLDRDGALRILIEKVRSALIEKFGTLPLPVTLAPPAADGSSLQTDLARLLKLLLSDLAGAGEDRRALRLKLAEEAVHAGGRRTLQAIALLPRVDDEVPAAVEQMRWVLVRLITVQARALRQSAPRHPDAHFSRYVRGLRE